MPSARYLHRPIYEPAPLLKMKYPSYKTLLDFPHAFLPLTVVIGQRRKYGDDLIAGSESIEVLRWFLELSLPRDTELITDDMFVSENTESLQKRFGERNLSGATSIPHLN
jgi:hypothetical protein